MKGWVRTQVQVPHFKEELLDFCEIWLCQLNAAETTWSNISHLRSILSFQLQYHARKIFSQRNLKLAVQVVRQLSPRKPETRHPGGLDNSCGGRLPVISVRWIAKLWAWQLSSPSSLRSTVKVSSGTLRKGKGSPFKQRGSLWLN